MEYTMAHPSSLNVQVNSAKNISLFQRFVNWTDKQEAEYHIAWVGVSVISMAAVLFPFTLAVILLNGAAFGLIIAAMISLVLVVILNLAAMSARYTIPAFLLAVLIDAGAILVSFLI